MKRFARPILVLASLALLAGCSGRERSSIVYNGLEQRPDGPFLLTAGDNLGYALYNTQKGMLARGYPNLPVQLPAVAGVPGLD